MSATGPTLRPHRVTQPPIDEPDFLDDATVEWAREHREVLERVVDHLLATGDWPIAEDLTRQFVREGQPIPIRSVLFSMPKALGFLEDRLALERSSRQRHRAAEFRAGAQVRLGWAMRSADCCFH